jgi:predicted enzyme related to lactoylglutathione lyase
MQRAKTFYEKTLATKLAKLQGPGPGVVEMLTFPMNNEKYGTTGSLVKMEGGPAGTGNATIVYFECDDCAIEAGRVRANGGSIMKEKFSIGQYGFIALAFDTEGNMFGLHSMK